MALRFKSRPLNEIKGSEVFGEDGPDVCPVPAGCQGCFVHGWNQELFQKTGICWYQSTLELLTLWWSIPFVSDTMSSLPFVCGIIGIASVLFISKIPYCRSNPILSLICIRSFLSLCSFVLLSLVRGRILNLMYSYVSLPYAVSCVIALFEAVCYGESKYIPYKKINVILFALFNMASAVLLGVFIDFPPHPSYLWTIVAALFSLPRLFVGVRLARYEYRNLDLQTRSVKVGRILCVLVMVLDMVSAWLLVFYFGSRYILYSVIAKAFGWFLICGIALQMFCTYEKHI